MDIETVCDIESFRRFMIISTCRSFIPRSYLEDEAIFPERPREQGTMYVEAEDKQSLRRIRNIQFMRVSSVLGIIYNSMSGRTTLKWRNTEGNFGKLIGEASINTIANLFAAGVLDRSYVEEVQIRSTNSHFISDTS